MPGWTARRSPIYQACLEGPSPVLVTFLSKRREATFKQIRYRRARCPGREIFFRRDYAGRRTRIASVRNVGAVGEENIG